MHLCLSRPPCIHGTFYWFNLVLRKSREIYKWISPPTEMCECDRDLYSEQPAYTVILFVHFLFPMLSHSPIPAYYKCSKSHKFSLHTSFMYITTHTNSPGYFFYISPERHFLGLFFISVLTLSRNKIQIKQMLSRSAVIEMCDALF